MMIKELNLFRIAGLLLLLTGVSHMAQILIYEPTRVVKVATLFGVVYTLLGLFALKRISWLPWLVIPVCAVGFIGGTTRMLAEPFNIQFAVHQLIHIVIISTFLLLVFQRRKNRLGAP